MNYFLHNPIDSKAQICPSVHMALLRLAPSKFAFVIFEAVKSDPIRLALLKFAPIRVDPWKLTLVKFALVKFDSSKFAPCKLDS